MEYVCDERRSVRSMRKLSQTLPGSVQKMYDKLYDEIASYEDETSSAIAQTAFTWLSATPRSPNWEDFEQMLNVVIEPQHGLQPSDVIAACNHFLVWVNGWLNTGHFSASEYLRDRKLIWNETKQRFQFARPAPDLGRGSVETHLDASNDCFAAHICLQLLLQPSLWYIRKSTSSDESLRSAFRSSEPAWAVPRKRLRGVEAYIALFWPYHCALSSLVNQPSNCLRERFLEIIKHFSLACFQRSAYDGGVVENWLRSFVYVLHNLSGPSIYTLTLSLWKDTFESLAPDVRTEPSGKDRALAKLMEELAEGGSKCRVGNVPHPFLIAICFDWSGQISDYMPQHEPSVSQDKISEVGFLLAVKYNNGPLARHLFSRIPAWSIKLRWGENVVHLAASAADSQMITFLVKEGGFPHDEASLQGKTPLAIAAGDRRTDIVLTLLQLGADPNGVPLAVAAQAGCTDIVLTLLEHGADPNGEPMPSGWDHPSFRYRPLHGAIRSHNLDCLRLLLEHGAGMDILTGSDGVLQTCAMYSEGVEEMEMLKNMRGNVLDLDEMIGDQTALLAAIMCGHINQVRWLVSKGADVNIRASDGTNALMFALLRWRVRILTDFGRSESMRIIEFLIQAGARLDIRDNLGATTLLYAAGTGNLSAFRILLDEGASVTERDDRGRSALIYASRLGYANVVAHLLETHNVDVDGRTLDGSTALLDVAGEFYQKGMYDVAELLILHGADINAADGKGRSPFLKACCAGAFHEDWWRDQIQFLGFLLQKGADPFAKDAQGRSAIYMAKKMNWVYQNKVWPWDMSNESWYWDETNELLGWLEGKIGKEEQVYDIADFENGGCSVGPVWRTWLSLAPTKHGARGPGLPEPTSFRRTVPESARSRITEADR